MNTKVNIHVLGIDDGLDPEVKGKIDAFEKAHGRTAFLLGQFLQKISECRQLEWMTQAASSLLFPILYDIAHEHGIDVDKILAGADLMVELTRILKEATRGDQTNGEVAGG